MEENRGVFKMITDKPTEKDLCEGLGVGRKTILKCILKNCAAI